MSQSFVIKMFFTSISKYYGLSYSFCADQLNEHCPHCGLSALGLLSIVFLLVLDSARSAVSVMVLTAAFVALVAACVIG